MNAFELADFLDDNNNDNLEVSTKGVSNMLRQQAGRIAELEKLISEMKYEKSSGVYEKQSEPVAWMSENGKFIGTVKDEIQHIPLYATPQTKPLSDEADIEDYKVALDDVKRLTRELDVALNGNGAAQQASLCDIVCQVKSNKWKLVQTKPLSDEEIEEIAKQHLSAFAQFIGAGETWYEGEIEFARAIEAKVRGQ